MPLVLFGPALTLSTGAACALELKHLGCMAQSMKLAELKHPNMHSATPALGDTLSNASALLLDLFFLVFWGGVPMMCKAKEYNPPTPVCSKRPIGDTFPGL